MQSKPRKELANNKAVVLDNTSCTYCGCNLSQDSDNTKEHVVGRRFVPKGSLNGCWNLIVRACKDCNSYKSELENDISAITLFGKVWCDLTNSEEIAIKEARRKSRNSISNKTKKKVSESQEHSVIEQAAATGFKSSFGMISPPQIESKRIYELARLQLMAFFYLMTYEIDTKKGGFWPEGYHPLTYAPTQDWGNELLLSFMDTVNHWEPCWVGNTALGYFKSIIRKHPNETCWSWAIEWNKNYRVVGFFGSRQTAQKLIDSYTFPEMIPIKTEGKLKHYYRREVRLLDGSDTLFEPN